MKDIRAKSDTELYELVQTSRETLCQERFKDAYTRKANIIHTAKKDVARALTELRARQSRNATAK
jgi:ribosomal protein L29